MSLYDNEENAIVNNANDTSETPSNLVNESPDQEYNKNGAKLSPNPAGFGFIKQLFVTPENTATNGEPNLPGEPNVLYLVQVINDGALVGFRKYKWTPSDGFVQFGASPDLKLKDSPRETPTRVENEPKKNLAQVFNGDIAVNGDLFVKGQKVEGSADPLTPSEVVDIVNEGIEGGDINVVANPTLVGTEDPLTGLQIGDTKYGVASGAAHCYWLKLSSDQINGIPYYTDKDNLTTLEELRADLTEKGTTGTSIKQCVSDIYNNIGVNPDGQLVWTRNYHLFAGVPGLETKEDQFYFTFDATTGKFTRTKIHTNYTRTINVQYFAIYKIY